MNYVEPFANVTMIGGKSKISVIIPVYNVAPFLERCLDSIARQTLKELEVILVDDHGKDESMTIARKFIEARQVSSSWHIVETPQNAGPGVARNVGMEHATGEYIAFCDADDWVEPTMYERLYVQAQKHHADLSSAAAILDYPDGSTRVMRNPEIGCGKVTYAQRRLILRHFVSNFTTMLFRREWLNEYAIRFPDSKSGEDSCFMGECYLTVARIAQIDAPLYHYVIHGDSISHGKHVWRGKAKRQAFGALINFAKSHGLWHDYRRELVWIYIKKALLTPIIEWIHY